LPSARPDGHAFLVALTGKCKCWRPFFWIGKLLTVSGYAGGLGGGGRKPPMSQTVPVVALVVLVVLSVIAKERKYDMTSAGLMVLTGVLAVWLGALFFKLG
jgi:hypothetical protein